jgi:hypothetical protein
MKSYVPSHTYEDESVIRQFRLRSGLYHLLASFQNPRDNKI